MVRNLREGLVAGDIEGDAGCRQLLGAVVSDGDVVDLEMGRAVVPRAAGASAGNLGRSERAHSGAWRGAGANTGAGAGASTGTGAGARANAGAGAGAGSGSDAGRRGARHVSAADADDRHRGGGVGVVDDEAEHMALSRSNAADLETPVGQLEDGAAHEAHLPNIGDRARDVEQYVGDLELSSGDDHSPDRLALDSAVYPGGLARRVERCSALFCW